MSYLWSDSHHQNQFSPGKTFHHLWVFLCVYDLSYFGLLAQLVPWFFPELHLSQFSNTKFSMVTFILWLLLFYPQHFLVSWSIWKPSLVGSTRVSAATGWREPHLTWSDTNNTPLPSSIPPWPELAALITPTFCEATTCPGNNALYCAPVKTHRVIGEGREVEAHSQDFLFTKSFSDVVYILLAKYTTVYYRVGCLRSKVLD